MYPKPLTCTVCVERAIWRLYRKSMIEICSQSMRANYIQFVAVYEVSHAYLIVSRPVLDFRMRDSIHHDGLLTWTAALH